MEIVFLRLCFCCVWSLQAASACIHSGQPAHTVTALTLYRLCSTPPPPPSLPVSALLACIRCVSQAASQQQTFGEEKRGLRSHTVRLRCAWTYRGENRILFSFPRCCVLSLKIISALTPPLTLPVWMVDCRFDGAEQARLIEGLRPGGHLWGRRERNLCPRLRPSSVL